MNEDLKAKIFPRKIDWNLTFPLPQLADIVVLLAVSIGAGVTVSGTGERVYYGIGPILTGCSPASEGEDTADSEGRSTGSRATSSQTGALRGSVASSVETAGANAGLIWKPDHVENGKLFVIPLSKNSNSEQVKPWRKIFKN